MDFAVPMGFNASAEGDDADNYPDIRLYTVQKCRGGSPNRCVRRGPGPSLEFLNASFSGQRWVSASRDSVYGQEAWTPQDYPGWEARVGQVAGGRGFSAACVSVVVVVVASVYSKCGGGDECASVVVVVAVSV